MEFNRKKVIRELDALHHRILNSKLAEKITEKEILAIINAASFLIEDGKKIKELKVDITNEILVKAEYAAEYSEDFGCPVVKFDELQRMVKEISEEIK